MNASQYIDFTLLKTLPPSIQCTRSGATANYFNNAGLLVNALANTVRWGSKGLLIEPQATNLFYDSRNLSAASWSISGTHTLSNSVSLDGTIKNIQIGSFSGSSAVTMTYTLTGTLTSTHTFSCYVNTTKCRVSVSFGGTTKTMPQNQNKLFTITGTNPTNVVFTITPTFGSFTSDSKMVLDCCQVEATSYNTTPIHTTGASVTRNADLVFMQITQSNANTWFDVTNGTFMINAELNFLSSTEQSIAEFTANTGATSHMRVGVKRTTSTQVNITYNFTTSNWMEFYSVCDTPGTTFQIATSYVDGTNSMELFSVGGKSPIPLTQQTENVTFSTVNRLFLGSYNGSNTMCGYIKRFGFIKATASQIELNNLSINI